ncbi:NAD(P)/FAD-dependent oxidoreductase [Yinghuangia seranimata]|uniref:NAD(P)/FAD-dependent oxidoreductase n=1 Tax=Yinghuangia seranimata TaxID=408067 RepID=UPI00248BA89C|nr:FAD-dependent monooxygenase [Yinghuangia seranimata]MDI2125949.1 FAD-dependent monooxygenase [Yinghuangia seranimata]
MDRAGFPSDTVSSHQVQIPGVARLAAWGVLDRLQEAGTPPTRRIRFDAQGVVLDGEFPAGDGGVDTLYSPRRSLLDSALVDAARAAGAEVRERARVEELVWSEGRVTGVRLSSGRGGAAVTESARLVVGADGKHSSVAQAVGARVYREVPVRAFASYTYWRGLPTVAGGGEMYQRRGQAVAVFPTNDDLTMVYLSCPIAEFDAFRTNLEGNYRARLARCGDLGERLAAAERVERLRTTPDQPNRFRVPYGPGWALVGDAGVVMDSVSAQGISNALRDAELLADAAGAALLDPPAPGPHGEAAPFAAYHRLRDRGIAPMYGFTTDLARHTAGRTERLFFAALAGRPDEISRCLGAFAGITRPDRYFTAGTLLRAYGGRVCSRAAA